MTALAEIFAPLIPAIIVGGLILGFRNCIDIVGWGMKLSGGQKQWLSIACVH
jgi:sugar phosphotransferase system (PTS), IIABC component